jgi:uncharacterized protein YchJ
VAWRRRQPPRLSCAAATRHSPSAPVDYLARTWHPLTRAARIDVDSPLRWLGLRVRCTEAGWADDSQGVVEFVARY